jgi:hypothetical protein
MPSSSVLLVCADAEELRETLDAERLSAMRRAEGQ